MKIVFNNFKILVALSVILLAMGVSSCTNNQPSGQFFGKEFVVDQTESLDAYIISIDEEKSIDPEEVKLSGVIEEVCQSKGCWMILKTSDETKVRVTFKDYGFFVPMDAMGKEVILEGLAQVKDLDSATLKHYAEDAGKPVAEMSPRELSIVAEGVLIL